ncbi:MAG: TonB-dependent receptor [Usitatibacter sp.]
MKKIPRTCSIALLVLAALAPVASAAKAQQGFDIADLSLEQLTSLTVTSASRREEKVIEAAASIFVITAEDIRHSGASSLPEALRLAPNLQVVRGDTSQYVISARGGLAGTANKMLVLLDGRTLYTPLFAGVFWDAQDIFIEDIDRIEVISGPGATLWGTNAVNGVINVISKSSARTQGVFLSGGAGNMERGAGARFGGELPNGGHYRVYGKYVDRDAHPLASGATARDSADRRQGGFRADWDGAVSALTLQGDIHSANVDNLGGERPVSGGNLLARWRHQQGPDTDFMLQVYYDHTQREHFGSFKEQRDTYDAELQYGLKAGANHRFVFGAGYRTSHDQTELRPSLSFQPAERTLGFASLFAQDEIDFGSRLSATLGVRAEHNTYTGIEWLPNVRLSFAATDDQVFWAALTRAVRAPSRIDRDVFVPGVPPYALVGNDTYGSEMADVVELGYRARYGDRLSVSVTAFHHRFRDLRTVKLSSPLTFGNGGRGNTRGVEAWGDYLVTRDWRLVWGFLYMKQSEGLDAGNAPVDAMVLGNDPKRTASLRSLWHVTRQVDFDVTARYVGSLPAPAVPSYSNVDLRLGWRVLPKLELSLLVGNVADHRHSEFSTPAIRAVFERTYFVKASWSL